MSSGFVTESEIAEARKKRQEEWEKVRQPDEPLGNVLQAISMCFSPYFVEQTKFQAKSVS